MSSLSCKARVRMNRHGSCRKSCGIDLSSGTGVEVGLAAINLDTGRVSAVAGRSTDLQG